MAFVSFLIGVATGFLASLSVRVALVYEQAKRDSNVSTLPTNNNNNDDDSTTQNSA